jgi:hypothetical protein
MNVLFLHVAKSKTRRTEEYVQNFEGERVSKRPPGDRELVGSFVFVRYLKEMSCEVGS